MNLKIAVVGVAVLITTGGCASQAEIDHDAVFGAEYRAALAHPSPEMRISALKAVKAPSDEDALRLYGAILYQAATGQPKKFAAEAAAVLPALEQVRLHEVSRELQVLAYLGATVNGKPEMAEKLAAREIRVAVDAGCAYPTPMAYATLSPESGKSFKRILEFNMASACIAALSGREAEALSKLVSAAAIIRATGMYANDLVEAGVDSSPATATRFFFNRLRKQHNLNFNSYAR